jgi:hypothetical protein
MMEQTETLSGAKAAQNIEMFPNMDVFGDNTQPTSDPSISDEFTYFEMKIAKRFLQLLGGKERALKVIENVGTVQSPSISDIADMMPDIQSHAAYNISGMYNPSAIQ